MIEALEREVASVSRYRVTTSAALSVALQQAYRCEPIEVVYNSFQTVENDGAERAEGPVRLHWFSQTIGPGRGLETLFQALQSLDPEGMELHLRGRLFVYENWLNEVIPPKWRGRVFIHPVVHPDDLGKSVAVYDVGLALEESTVLSRDLTITNKIFQYVNAGLAVIATDTTGQREFASGHPGAVQLVHAADPDMLASMLSRVRSDPGMLVRMRASTRSAPAMALSAQYATIQRAAARALER
jgi:glycosyltransferase involved in cell wall biosynthesis